MNRTHLSPDQLIDLLYEIAPADAHLNECPECSAKLREMRARQAEFSSVSTSEAFYHRQRRQILERMAEPARPAFAPTRSVWVPAAVAALLVVGMVVSRPKPRVAAPRVAETVAQVTEVSADSIEAGWFEDTYTEMQGSEPRALSPMRNLFAEGAANQ